MNKNSSNKYYQNNQNHQKSLNTLVQKFEIFWCKCRNACNLTKRRGKRVLLCVEEENLCDFDSEKDQKKKKKFEWEGIERGIEEEEDKALKNCDLIPIFFFFLNTIFDRLRGIEIGIKNH